jgi:hypothetical protein
VARLFISHASADNVAAIALRDWLVAEGYRNEVFLDIDPDRGIMPGTRWREALKVAADRCEAVLVLISRSWLASRWCRNEFDLARILHKRIFLLMTDPVPLSELPSEMRDEWQVCQLAAEHAPGGNGCAPVVFCAAGLEILRRGLLKAGIGAGSFPWPPPSDPARIPYRGLKALEFNDAAIFFGRDAAIVRGLDRIRGILKGGIDHILVVLGASGAGKSSYLRAGLWPRLRRDDMAFIPLPVVRPQSGVISGATGLAQALAGAFQQHGRPRAPGDLKERLLSGLGEFGNLLDELLALVTSQYTGLAQEHDDPAIVLGLDQAEELFNPEAGEEASIFLDVLTDAFATTDVGLRRCRLLVVCTIRSDRYELLQTAPRLAALRQDLFNLPPISPADFKIVIEGPARRAAEAGKQLAIDPILTEHLVADAQGADALPLLAFTLERLYADYASSGQLNLDNYLSLGGVQGSIEAAVTNALAEPGNSLPATEEERLQHLRAAFIPWLVRIHPDTGEPMRRVAQLSEIPASSRPMVERLVAARLLVTDRRGGTDVIEIAHESLLRQWPALTSWLAEDRADLQLLSRLEPEAIRWDAADPADKEGLLLPPGMRLTEAEDFLARRPDLLGAAAAASSFIRKSSEAQLRRRQELEQSRRRRLRQARLVASAMAVLALFSIVSAGIVAIGANNVKHGLGLVAASIEVKLSDNPLSLTKKSLANLQTDVHVLSDFLLSRVALLNVNPELSSAWSAAQMAAALDGIPNSPLTPEKFKSVIDGRIDRSCWCWKEAPDKLPHAVATSWVLYSMARYGISPPKEAVSAVLDRQAPNGWWSMFPTTGDERNASTSATSYSILALNELSTRHLVSPNDEARITLTIDKAIAWLKQTRVAGSARWKEYPDGQEVDGDYVAVSAVVMTALRRADRGAWDTALDAEWLRELPRSVSGIFDYDQSKALIYLKNGELSVDEVRHYQLPWIFVATADSYSNASLLDRASANLWMNSELVAPISQKDLNDRDWVASELLISFNHVLGVISQK